MRRESNIPEFYNFFVYSSSCNSLFFGLLLSSFLSPFVNKYKMKAKCSENEAEKDIIIWNAIQKNCKILDYYCRLTWIATNCRSWLLRHQVKWEWQPNSTQQCAWRDNATRQKKISWLVKKSVRYKFYFKVGCTIYWMVQNLRWKKLSM